VEAVLTDVPGVAEVAVFGLPDDRWGQRVCAAVVTARGAVDDDVVAAVATHAAAHLAGYKRPKEYRVVDALPRTATGKVRRLALSDGDDPVGAGPEPV
jgi:acyl-CoA synthetase (AMP-forming)/AMP-acid ligase II